MQLAQNLSVPIPKKDVRSPTALGVSMLLLLLSSIPMEFTTSGNSLSSDRTSGPKYAHSAQNAAYANTPYLAYVTSLVLGDDIDINRLVTLGDDDETSSTASSTSRRKRSPSSELISEEIAALSTSSSRSISNPPSPHSGSWMLQLPIPSTYTNSSVIAINSFFGQTELLGNVLKYLNLSDVDACRLVNSSFAAASEQSIVSHAVSGYRFIKFDESAECPDTHKANICGSKWNCANCNTINFHMSESCVHCKEYNGIYRVFLGQLRKEKTAELVRFMIRMLFPGMEVYHVESHTNPLDGRGKGCAWVYVSSYEEAQELLSLNKRMFVDINANGEEGIWFCNSDLTDDLAGFAVNTAYSNPRHQHLPRQPIVAELPKNSRAAKGKPTRRSPKKSLAPATAPASVDDSFSSNEQAYVPPQQQYASAPAKPFNYHQRQSTRHVTAEHYLPAESATYARRTPPPVSHHHDVYANHPTMCNCESCYSHHYHVGQNSMRPLPRSATAHDPYKHPLIQSHAEVDYKSYYPSRGYLPANNYGFVARQYPKYQQRHHDNCPCEKCISNAW